MQLSSIMQLLFDIVWNYAGTLNVFWNYYSIIIEVCWSCGLILDWHWNHLELNY